MDFERRTLIKEGLRHQRVNAQREGGKGGEDGGGGERDISLGCRVQSVDRVEGFRRTLIWSSGAVI